jgi:hypothetical protein
MVIELKRYQRIVVSRSYVCASGKHAWLFFFEQFYLRYSWYGEVYPGSTDKETGGSSKRLSFPTLNPGEKRLEK